MEGKEGKRINGFRVLSYFWIGKEIYGHKTVGLGVRKPHRYDFGGQITLSCSPAEGRLEIA